MSSIRHHTLTLSGLLAAHLGVSHWAVSMRVAKRGTFIDRLQQGGDLTGATYDKTVQRFSEIWPEDLEWPTEIPRPTPQGRKAS